MLSRVSVIGGTKAEVIYSSLSLSESSGGGCVGRVIICGPSELFYQQTHVIILCLPDTRSVRYSLGRGRKG